MAVFDVHTVKSDGSAGPTLVYNNTTSSLVFKDTGESVIPTFVSDSSAVATVISKAIPGRKTAPKVLKISLGLSCNYECSYCSQRFVPHADSTNPEDIDSFISQLVAAVPDAPDKVEFWGGEPFVYWKTLKPLAERLRGMYPQAQFLTITNGSLLDSEKNEWLDKLGFSVGLSHDGPGYHVRGVDPLDDPEKKAAIMELYGRLHPQGRISVNAMMHSGNRSRASVAAWLKERFGPDVRIGEGAFIDPYDEGGMASTLDSATDHFSFRTEAFKELRFGLVSNFHISHQKMTDFINSVRTGRKAETLGQKCGMDTTDKLAVDLHGNVLTCQNVSAAATAPNGQPHKIGHLSDLSAVEMRTSTHWSQRQECANCPVLQLCKGSCMFLDGPLWDAGCDSSYSDNIPFLAGGIEYLTGLIPYYIEGDFRQERKDIFGQFAQSPQPAKKFIPIKPLPPDAQPE
jgi:uncharacterized protein